MNAVTNTSLALSLEDVHYTYTDEWTRKKHAVLKGLSLSVRAGESFGFLGHNGAGKTTTIKAILGLTHIQSGQIKIFDVDSRDPHSRASVGYLPEQPYFYDHLSVQEAMELYASLAGIPRTSRASAISSALSQVQMEARRKSRMRALSKGLTQRVALAQAIVASPRLLILDEPFSGLDPLGRREFKEILSQLKHAGTTIFMSSHILSDVEFLCDRASILVKGELKGVYDLREPLGALASAHYELTVRADETFVRACNPAPDHSVMGARFLRLVFSSREGAEAALRLALERKLEIQSFELEHNSLEDVFLSVTKQGGVGPRI